MAVVIEVPPFVLTELTGDKRVVSLVGRALPYRPVAFKGKMRVETVWYPGSPVATQQILGPQEEPTTVTGYWKDRFIKPVQDGAPVLASGAVKLNDSPVADAVEAVNLLDDVRSKGQLLRVTWGHLTRDGVLQEFEQRWHNPHDVEWAMIFEWQSKSEANPPAVITGLDQSDFNEDFANRMDALKEAADPGKANFKIFPDVAADITGAIEDATASAKGLIDLGSQVVRAALSPLDAARRTLASLLAAKDELDLAVAEASADLAWSLAIPTAPDFGEVLASNVYLRDTRKPSRDTRNLCIRQSQEVATHIGATQAPTVFLAKTDEDLRDVATKFYGTPDEWRTIAAFNGLSGSELLAGQAVLIPTARRRV